MSGLLRALTARLAAGITATLAVSAFVAAPAAVEAATTVPGCVAAHLKIVRGATQSATGHTFDRFRITNTGTSRCRLYGYPTFRFRNSAGDPIGYSSVPAGLPAKAVVLKPGATARTAVGTVVPAVVTEPGACKPRTARSVAIRLAFRPHVYVVAMTRRVCTTKQYRPTSYPVGF